MKTIYMLALLIALLSAPPSTLSEGRGEGVALQTTREHIQNTPRGSSRFEFIDVYVDPRGTPMAAYQFELKVDPATTQIVGVEGGEHIAFKAAPYYDPSALSKNRIIIAAFNTASDLPQAKTRVARMHLRTSTADAKYSIQLDTAGDSSGAKIHTATISFEKGPRS